MRRRLTLLLLATLSAATANATVFTLTGDPASTNGATWTLKDTLDNVAYDLSGVLLEPAGTGPFPAVIVSHGAGGNAFGYSRNVGRTMRDWGMVAIGVNYTHAGMVPVGLPGTANDRGASEANLLRARRMLGVLATRPRADTTRIAAHGHSMGGFVTAALVGTTPDRFRIASHSAAGVDDSKLAFTKIAQASGITIPYQAHHGDVDSTVDLSCDVRLDSLLTALAVPHELFVYPGYTHNAMPFDATMLQRVHDWYTSHGLWAAATAVGPPGPAPGVPRIEAMRRDGDALVLAIIWPERAPAEVELFDVLGRRLAEVRVDAAGSREDIVLAGVARHTGLFFARARQGQASAVRRFAVTR